MFVYIYIFLPTPKKKKRCVCFINIDILVYLLLCKTLYCCKKWRRNMALQHTDRPYWFPQTGILTSYSKNSPEKKNRRAISTFSGNATDQKKNWNKKVFPVSVAKIYFSCIHHFTNFNLVDSIHKRKDATRMPPSFFFATKKWGNLWNFDFQILQIQDVSSNSSQIFCYIKI